METIKTLSMTVCFVGIAITMLDLITPGEKLKKQVKLIYSLVILIIVATPIIRGDVRLELPVIESIESTPEFLAAEQTFQESLEAYFADNIKLAINQKLKVRNINAEEILVSVNKDEEGCISISEVNIVLAVQDKDMYDTCIEIVRNELGDIPVKIKIAEASNG